MTRTVLIFAFALGLAACSGDSGGFVAAPQIFGDYSLATFQEDGAGNAVARPVRTNFNEPGFIAVDYDLDGEAEEALPYQLSASGTITVNGVPVGAVSPDHQLMVGGNLNPLEPRGGITIGAAAKTARGIGNYAFAGKYVGCALGGDTATGAYWTRRLLCSADGVNGFQFAALADSEGASASGTLNFDILDGNVQLGGFVGTIAISGFAAMFALPSASTPEFLVLIRKSEGASQATLSGNYAGFLFSRDAGHTYTARVVFSANGAGSCSLAEQRSDGTSASSVLDYGVIANGSLTIGDDLEGIVSGNGHFFAAVDTDNGDGKISFLLAVRQG